MTDKIRSDIGGPEGTRRRFIESGHRSGRGEEANQPAIIQADTSDAGRLAALHAQALPPGWPAPDFAAYCSDPSRAVLKAVKGACLLGLAVLQFAADEAEILSIAVAKESRRQGVASHIMQASLAACQRKSIKNVYLEAAEGNEAAKKLYEKFGFAVIAHRKDYYQSTTSAPVTALIMRLDVGRSLSSID